MTITGPGDNPKNNYLDYNLVVINFCEGFFRRDSFWVICLVDFVDSSVGHLAHWNRLVGIQPSQVNLTKSGGICQCFWSNYSDLTPNWWFSKGNPLISGKSKLVKYYNLARCFNRFKRPKKTKHVGKHTHKLGLDPPPMMRIPRHHQDDITFLGSGIPL